MGTRSRGNNHRKASSKTKKVSPETLTALVDARQDADLANAEAQNLMAHFQLMVARELKEAHMPIQSSAICMTCGTIRPANVPCPECPVPVQPQQ